MRRHSPQEADTIPRRGNIGMITPRHQDCIAFAHHSHQFRFVRVCIDKLDAESRRRHFDIDVHLFQHPGVLMRRPARPVSRIGDSKARQHPSGYHILADKDVEIARGGGSAGDKVERLVFADVGVAYNLQRIVAFDVSGELRQVSHLAANFYFGTSGDVSRIELGQSEFFRTGADLGLAAKADERGLLFAGMEGHLRRGSIGPDPSVAEMLHAAICRRGGYLPAGMRMRLAKNVALASNRFDHVALRIHDFLSYWGACVPPLRGLLLLYLFTQPLRAGLPLCRACGAAQQEAEDQWLFANCRLLVFLEPKPQP